nr:hypothetical protein [Tanacetum cinerariifolium]
TNSDTNVLLPYNAAYGASHRAIRGAIGSVPENHLQREFRRRPPAKGVGLRVADSHTGNHPEDDFTPLENIRRSYSVIRERISFELEGETFKPEREDYSGEPSVNLLRSFLNLGRVGDWLTLSNRGGAHVPKALIKPCFVEMDFRSFMIQGVNGEFNFLPEGGFEDNQGSFFVKSVNNKTHFPDTEPISVVLPANVANNIIDSSNTSSDDELPLVYPPTSSFPEVGEKSKAVGKRKLTVQASKVDGDASTPLDVDSDPDIHEFPSARELKDIVTGLASCDAIREREREVKRDKAYLVLEKKCNEALQDLDKNPLVSDMCSEIETLQGREIDKLRKDRVAVVSKVVPDTAMKLVHSNEIGFLIARLVREVIVHGRCTTFKEIAKLKEPFVLEKIPIYRMSSKDEYDRVGEDMTNASFLFLFEFT